jgi:hypothetical protein
MDTIYNALYVEVPAAKVMFSCKLIWNHFILEPQSTKSIFNTFHFVSVLTFSSLSSRPGEKRQRILVFPEEHKLLAST